ncbi:MAG: hypothetical protein WAM66_12795 [Acidobacteriaceae bacterium]
MPTYDLPIWNLSRRTFLSLLAAAGAAEAVKPLHAFAEDAPALLHGSYLPGRIANEYSLYLHGEKDALSTPPAVSEFGEGVLAAKSGPISKRLRAGESIGGWRLLAIAEMNGVETAVFEKHVTHRGAVAYVTERGGPIAVIPKHIGDLSKIRPRATNNPHGIKLERAPRYVPGPDATGDYILHSEDDPHYENVAALGPEYVGWSLVANEEAGPLGSIYLEADGKSRELPRNLQATWAPDQTGTIFDPEDFFPFDSPQSYAYKHGWSKRTLLGGYLPVADTGVWNEEYQAGYEVMMLLPPGVDAQPMARVRLLVPANELPPEGDRGDLVLESDGKWYRESYWHSSPEQFFASLAGIWNRWSLLHEEAMPVEIPDEWLLDAARAGITLCRCSYRGLNPTYQIGEGAYTKIPERSHALFPVAHYEFIWAQQLWNQTSESDPYFQHYLDNYILPDGNFLYNTQDQVEAPLNVGLFLWNSARAYDYTRDVESFERHLPILTRMLDYVLARYAYSKQRFPKTDRRYGLIWGSPEADLGEVNNDFPDSHPYYFQNATCTWRGLREHARVLKRVAADAGKVQYSTDAARYDALAKEMRGNTQRSLEETLAACNPAMKRSGITPFEPNDTKRRPTQLSSYENHRFMMDWFLADWGDKALDLGHLKHRIIAGEQICGLNTDGDVARTSNFMSHGTLAVKIRQEDYRPFLLTLYALVCYAADSGNRFAPEDAYIPGGHPGEQSRYGWAAVVNSTLQPTLGLRWMLCYEESDSEVCHLQKAAPKHWFAKGERISVKNCPTRFGHIGWTTEAINDREWKVSIDAAKGFSGDVLLHIHPPDGKPLSRASMGAVNGSWVKLDKSLFGTRTHLSLEIS